MNHRLILEISKSFREAHDRCVTYPCRDGTLAKPQYIPAVVCIAFSIEIGLKAILAFESNGQGGHNLQKLFVAVSKPRRMAIAKNTGYDDPTFEAALAGVANAFVDWRYVYESNDGLKVSEQFLMLFASAVHAVAETLGDA